MDIGHKTHTIGPTFEFFLGTIAHYIMCNTSIKKLRHIISQLTTLFKQEAIQVLLMELDRIFLQELKCYELLLGFKSISFYMCCDTSVEQHKIKPDN